MAYAASECKQPFYKVDAVCTDITRLVQKRQRAQEKQARKDAKLAWEQEKGIREAAKLLKAKEREANKEVNRDVANLLRKEADVRESVRMMTARGHIEIDAAGVEWKQDPQTKWWWWRNPKGEWRSTNRHYTRNGAPARRPSPSSEDSKSTASTVSTAATATPAVVDEYKELRRLQQKLKEIDLLQDRKSQGETLSKYEESAIRRRAEFYYAPVMVKHRSKLDELD